jgi:hypothetical protein
MNPNYLVHRAERPLTRAEQRAADVRQGELAEALAGALGPLSARLRAVRLGWRRRPAGALAARNRPAVSPPEVASHRLVAAVRRGEP